MNLYSHLTNLTEEDLKKIIDKAVDDLRFKKPKFVAIIDGKMMTDNPFYDPTKKS